MRKLIVFLSLILPSVMCADMPTSEFLLKNGLKLVVREDHRSPVVTSQVWYKVGSAYEPWGITGISHALEHMMFRGTPAHPGNTLSITMANIGAEQNASTSSDFTFYYQRMSKDKLPISFELEADRMQHALIDPTAFSNEIQVVMEERRLNDDQPQNKLMERFRALAFLSTTYRHPPIGWMNDIQHLTANDLHQWYNTWYAPNNATLVVVGDVNPQETLALAKKYFEPIPPKVIPSLKPQEEIPALGERRTTITTQAEVPVILIGYNVPSLKTTNEAWEIYALDVIATLLDGTQGSRHQKNIVRKNIASETSLSYVDYSKFPTLFTIYGVPAPGHTLEELEKVFLVEIDKLKNTPVTQEELNRAKMQAVATKYYNMDSLTTQANEIGILESVGLSWHVSEDYVANIQQVTPAQIQTVAKKYFVTDRRTVAILNPLKA